MCFRNLDKVLKGLREEPRRQIRGQVLMHIVPSQTAIHAHTVPMVFDWMSTKIIKNQAKTENLYFFKCRNLKMKKKKNRKRFHKYVLKNMFSQPRQGFGGFTRRNSNTNSETTYHPYCAIQNAHIRPYCPQKKKK